MKYKKQNFIHKLFDWKVPYALPLQSITPNTKEYTWEQWSKDLSSKHPIKFFLFERIPNKIYSILYILDIYYFKIKSLFFLKQHLLDLRPKNGIDYQYGFLDVERQILFSNMSVLCNYIESFKSIENYKIFIRNQKEDLKLKLNEGLEIYLWWKSYYNNYIKKENIIYNKIFMLRRFNKDLNEINRLYSELNNLDKIKEQEEEEYLIKLIKIRKELLDGN